MKKNFTILLWVVFFLPKSYSQFNYAEGLQKALFFYEVQRSGIMPSDNRVSWRGNAHLNDGKDMGWDMAGGWYDAGDNVKWNVSMAFAGSTLALSAMEYKAGYANTGQMPYLINNLKCVSDYFLKCIHYTAESDLTTYKIVIDIAAGNPDHGHWASSEVAHLLVTDRKTYYADKDYPNAGTVAAMAGTLAASSWVMRDNGNASLADQYLAGAEKLYKFAKTYRTSEENKDKCKDSQGNVVSIAGYGSIRDFDELTWAAATIHKAQKQKNVGYADTYLNDAKQLASTIAWADPYDSPHSHFQMGNYHLYSYFLLARLVPTDDQYIKRVARDAKCYASISCPGQPIYEVSPGGLSKINYEWGTLRHNNNAAFITFLYADMATNEPDKDKLISWAKSQLDYSLGNNPLNLSYMAGFAPAGKTAVTSAHHRTAYGPWAGFEHLISGKPEYNITKTRHTIYGALLGGPNWGDAFTPNVGDPEKNEVALDYQAGFTGNLARMAKIAPGGQVLPNFPAVEQKDPEY
ncbi:MAG TPA: glycoside hydrolase family 9 protein, partial [Cytophagaceae bacterium]